jgi:hypothetical protein
VWLAGSVSCLLAAAGSTEAQHILYVDQDATGPVHDGSTWCEAYAELYEALAVATSGDTILVGESVYLPDTTELQNPRQATFQLANGITIEGGYAGCGAPDPDERDIVVY